MKTTIAIFFNYVNASNSADYGELGDEKDLFEDRFNLENVENDYTF